VTESPAETSPDTSPVNNGTSARKADWPTIGMVSLIVLLGLALRLWTPCTPGNQAAKKRVDRAGKSDHSHRRGEVEDFVFGRRETDGDNDSGVSSETAAQARRAAVRSARISAAGADRGRGLPRLVRTQFAPRSESTNRIRAVANQPANRSRVCHSMFRALTQSVVIIGCESCYAASFRQTAKPPRRVNS
jgi:hypothetical protein